MTVISECNCGNCPKATLTRGDNWLHAGVICGGKEILPDGFATIKQKGCLSHPKAREVLMRDVVEELEKKKIVDPHDDESENYNFGIEEAISLIRDGVKKE